MEYSLSNSNSNSNSWKIALAIAIPIAMVPKMAIAIAVSILLLMSDIRSTFLHKVETVYSINILLILKSDFNPMLCATLVL